MVSFFFRKNFFFILLFLLTLNSFSQNRGGFITQKKGSLPGYILFAPLHSKITYLIDKCGKQVHSWKSEYPPGQSVYLLSNGDLLRTANDSNKAFKGGGTIERFGWDNKLKWSYKISSANECQHHDICPLPNGNILVLVWEKKTSEEAIKVGRNPDFLGPCIWSEKIIEIKPKGKNSAKIVWEWHVWDHLVQEFDPSKSNYGKVSQNQQLFNINFFASKEVDWLHFNSIAYNEELDQIMVSNRNFSEIFIIDHNTNVAQAASHLGGKSNRGGDILYRYGNPAAYDAGREKDQVLFAQHNAHWIGKHLKDEGKIMVFNNGQGRREKIYSSIDIITPPRDSSGNYYNWEKSGYSQLLAESESEINKGSIFSANVSSAQRLSNGNTLICSGATGRFCEIDEATHTVWLYINPVTIRGIAAQGVVAKQNQVFRCTLYEPEYSAFKGKKLKPGLPVEIGPVNYECTVGQPTK